MRDIANREAGKGISAPAKDLPGHRPTGTGRETGRIAASLGINIEDLIDEIDRLSWLIRQVCIREMNAGGYGEAYFVGIGICGFSARRSRF
jgi:hypothetical protein